jgi:AcrR family transcriptional regulator
MRITDTDACQIRLTITMSQDGDMTAPGRTYGGVSAAEREESRRASLIEAARRIIAEHGVAAVSAEQVCQLAGLTKRYFYESFATRDALLDSCAELLFTHLRITMEAALEAPTRQERVDGVARAVVRALASDPAWARLYTESPAFPNLRKRQQRAVDEFTGRLARDAMPFVGRTSPDGQRTLATRVVVAGATDLITSWLNGEVEADEQTIVATITATARGVAAAF